MTEDPDDRTRVGWKEWIAFPEWGDLRVRAKIDTGARTSALHVENVVLGGGDEVRFDVVTRDHPQKVTRTVRAQLVRTARVKPSSGEVQERPVVKTRVRVGPLEATVELSLVSRTGMLCRMLLGRRALARLGVSVDPARRYCLSPPRRKRKRTRKPRRERGGS